MGWSWAVALGSGVPLVAACALGARRLRRSAEQLRMATARLAEATDAACASVAPNPGRGLHLHSDT